MKTQCDSCGTEVSDFTSLSASRCYSCRQAARRTRIENEAKAASGNESEATYNRLVAAIRHATVDHLGRMAVICCAAILVLMAVGGLTAWLTGWGLFLTASAWVSVAAAGVVGLILNARLQDYRDIKSFPQQLQKEITKERQKGAYCLHFLTLVGLGAILVATGLWRPLGAGFSLIATGSTEPFYASATERAEVQLASFQLALWNATAFAQPRAMQNYCMDGKFKPRDLPSLHKKLADFENHLLEMRDEIRDARREYEVTMRETGTPVDEQLVDFSLRNEALLSQHAGVWERIRVWTYSPEYRYSEDSGAVVGLLASGGLDDLFELSDGRFKVRGEKLTEIVNRANAAESEYRDLQQDLDCLTKHLKLPK